MYYISTRGYNNQNMYVRPHPKYGPDGHEFINIEDVLSTQQLIHSKPIHQEYYERQSKVTRPRGSINTHCPSSNIDSLKKMFEDRPLQFNTDDKVDSPAGEVHEAKMQWAYKGEKKGESLESRRRREASRDSLKRE